MATLRKNLAVRKALNPAAYAASASTGAWIAMRGYRRILFAVSLGATSDAVAVKVQKATDGTGTGATDITGKSASFTGTDDNNVGIIEVRDVDLGSGYSHVALVVTPAAASTYLSAVAIMGEPASAPVSNTPTDGVKFNVG
jgi:hypothetical protein